MINIFNYREKIHKPEDRKSLAKDRVNQVAIDQVTQRSNRILVSVRTHRFPWDMFPDTINIEETRITLIKRTFFSTSEVRSADIRDISNIFINISPLYAQIVIVSKTFSQNNMQISSLYKSEAIYLRRIVEGLRMFEAKNIDTSTFSDEELLQKLEKLSTVEIVR